MYKVYEFSISPKSVWISGDCHGDWDLLKYKIIESGIQNAVLIIAGDCGFGFEKEIFYHYKYNNVKRYLKERNITIIFVRGNHDDPQYFDGEKINFEYWKAVPDYSVLSFLDNGNEKYNVLCIGGAISIDRLRRIDSDYDNWMRGKDRCSYWFNEAPIYNPDILGEIKKNGIKISALITHTAPDFVHLIDNVDINKFTTIDSELIHDMINERLVMTHIYNHLIVKDKQPIELIAHGHFHQHSIYYSHEDVKVIALDRLNTNNNSWDVCPLKR